jgi:uncharacterized protein YbaR (Trm112 family)/SAM-dependent methyltransferase
MRRDILDILQCPVCGGGLKLKASQENSLEIRQGELKCLECGKGFPVIDGMIDLMTDLHPWVGKSRTAYRRSKKTMTGSWTAAELARLVHLDRTYVDDSQTNYRQLLSRLPAGGKWAVDLGAGTCWSTAALAGKGFRCVAVDISPDNKLELGETFMAGGVYFDRILADMNRLPFRDRTFGLAVASAALHHSYSLEAAIGEVSRVLESGGRLELANEPVKGLAESFLSREHGFGSGEQVPEKSYSLSRWLQILEQKGFSPRIYFPDSIRNRLLISGFDRTHKFQGLAALFSIMAHSVPGLVFNEPVLRTGHFLLGLPLSLSGTKEK